AGAGRAAHAKRIRRLRGALEDVGGARAALGDHALHGEELVALARLLEELPASAEEAAGEPLEAGIGAEPAERPVEGDELLAVRVARLGTLERGHEVICHRAVPG